jgi:hypothetical protein
VFTFHDVYSGKCMVCKKGNRIERQAFDVDRTGNLVRCVVIRDNKRSRPALMTVGYTCCDNPRCELHVAIGNRKAADAGKLMRKIRAAKYSDKPFDHFKGRRHKHGRR